MKCVILGVGNLLLKDEGIGVHVAQALKEMSLPEGVEVVDGGTSPDLPYLVGGADKLIVIDAVQAGGEPGSIYRLTPEEVTARPETLMSTHQMGLLESLRAIGLGGGPREIIIIGVEPKETGWGLEPSPELQKRLSEIIRVTLREIEGGKEDAGL
jgi:hydrogenase maturation protease